MSILLLIRFSADGILCESDTERDLRQYSVDSSLTQDSECGETMAGYSITAFVKDFVHCKCRFA